MTRTVLSLALGACCALLSSPASAGAITLDELKIQPAALTQTSVSGISSGAYMAVQFAVLNPTYVSALGAEAGGPFRCAGSGFAVPQALSTCMKGPEMLSSKLDADALAVGARMQLSSEEENKLRSMKVWLFNGTNDKTVIRPVTDKLKDFLQEMGIKKITYVKNLPAAHGHLVDLPGDSPEACSDQETVKKNDYLADCNFDGPKSILETAYGQTDRPRTAAKPERLYTFRQKALPEALMAEEGYVYVPEVCEKESCRVHVAFHGCHQGEEIGDRFAVRSGYNEWAEAYRAMILYPRIKKGASANPEGCWDWWGYTDATYDVVSSTPIALVAPWIAEDSRMKAFVSTGTYATKRAPQIQAVDAMVKALATKR